VLEPPSTDDRRIWDLWLTMLYQPAIVTADEVGILGALSERPAGIVELATRMDLDERAIGIVLRLLASLGLLVARDGRYQLTDQARIYLVRDSGYYWGNMMELSVNRVPVEMLKAKLRQKGSATGPGPHNMAKTDIEGWENDNIPPEVARRIAERMHSHSLGAARGLARNYDFSGVRHLLDVGGGSGCFTIALHDAQPQLHITLMELATMLEVALGYLGKAGVGSQVDTLKVDMFREPWPKGPDAILLSNIFHDWNTATNRWLAKKAYDCLPSGGRVLVHEMLLDDGGDGSATTASFSLLMLLLNGGQQYTFAELRTILEDAGFVDVEARTTGAYYSVTTGHKR
jgi:cyclopropane fatty-acyl-phospholipid synthase-like methyltransferase